MAIHEVRVGYKNKDVRGEAILHEAKRTLGATGLERVRTARVYRLEDVTDEEVSRLNDALFCESIDQESSIDGPLITDSPNVFEVAYKPGVMNPEVASIIKAAQDLGIILTAADTSTEYALYGDVKAEDIRGIVHGLLVNPKVERIIREKPETLRIAGEVGLVTTVSIREASERDLMQLSKDTLFLNLDEMKVLQDYFEELGRDPTDCEPEIIAGRWSEHCGHKTFKAKIITKDGMEKPPLYTRITETAKKYFGDQVISAFVDNSGVIDFAEGQALCGKVETHNSPSALDPYGGAMTGTGGVIRDIMGTGQGAKVVSSTDIFCFGPWNLDRNNLPPGCLHPDYIQRKVIAGVRDYGNRVGIPTNNGSIHYHEDFRAKPTVIVGAYGILPKEKAQKGEARVGDLVVVVGGRTGRDGIHGATFSSGEMTDRTSEVSSSAVQIGNAIEEKRTLDAILEVRDKDLIRAITDCGAAGFSSAIGEMGEETGVEVDISNAPLKYQGLAPWEIWMSESQERMVLAIDPSKKEEFVRICKKYNVEVTVLGSFDGSGRLKVKHGDQTVADLDYDFLKNGLPQRIIEASYEGEELEEKEPVFPRTSQEWIEVLKKVLSHGNVASKESVLRLYDHTVQGTNALPPFSGVHSDGPNDAVVITPILNEPYGMVLSHGLNPVLMRKDPYWGTVWAVTEAMANYVAVGGDPDQAAWVENYIWPYPTKSIMGSLDQSVDAVCDMMDLLKRPVVSGKDSLSSTYKNEETGQIIEIPPVLCMSVFGKIEDVSKTVTSDIKKPGSRLVLVGNLNSHMGGTTYHDVAGGVANKIPKVDVVNLRRVLKGVYKAISDGEVLACHDVSEGGVIGAVSEMCFGGDCGVDLDIQTTGREDYFLFNETAGCFVVELAEDKNPEEVFAGLPFQVLGSTKKKKEMKVEANGRRLFETDTDSLKRAWQEPLEEIFE